MGEEQIQQLNLIERSLSQIISQKQQFQSQIIEIDNALEEIKDKDEAYHIVGSLMIKKESKTLNIELTEKKKLYETRLETLEKQEHKLREQAESLRSDVIQNLEKK